MAIINGTGSNNALTGTVADDEINGLGGDDLLFGLTGNDTLDGGTGADIMFGGLGNDIYVVDDDGDIVGGDNGGFDTVRASVGFILQTGFEHLELQGATNIGGTGNAALNSITGNTGDNILSGLGGNDVLIGLDGNDTLQGGTGKDTATGGIGDDVYIVNDATDVLVEAGGGGTDTVQVAAGSFVMGDNIENMTVSGTGIGGKGNTLANTMTGNSAANTFYGMDNDDTLDGAGGADRLYGGNGNDVFVVDNARDLVVELAGQGTDQVIASASYKLSAEIEELVLAGVASINGTGNTGNNTITGNIGNNTLNGDGGVDTLIGGLGNDAYVVDTLTDILTENALEGEDTVLSSISYTLAAQFENLTLTGTAAINGTGTNSANTLTGNSAINILTGGDGNDAYVIGVGDTVVELALGGVADIVFSSISYALVAEVENLTLTGTGAINGTGNGLDNTITGNTGKNTLDGGLGNDTLVAGSTDVLVDAGGTDTLVANFSATLAVFMENLTLNGTANLNGTGNAGVNTITGNVGNNTLNGMGGLDSLIGGFGNDTYIVDAGAPVIIENPGEGIDTVRTSLTHILASGLENLVLTGFGNINGTGNGSDNSITGNAGANILDGGLGDDTFFIDALDTVLVDAGGSDTIVEGFGNYDISARPDLENIRLTGTGAFNLTGNGGNNTLTGNTAINTLDGGLGDDTFVISKGDVLIDAGGSDTVASNFSNNTSAGFENILLLGTGAWTASGDAGVNVLTGNNGNNILNGMGGADLMQGGFGNDTYFVDDAGDIVNEILAQGDKDTVKSTISFTLNNDTEILVLLGTANIDGTGGDNANTLTGNAGNNTLDGGLGDDYMSGGAGNDVFLVDSVNDMTFDSAGFDTVISTVSITIGSGIEVLTLAAGAGGISGTGNIGSNIIVGNDDANIINGDLGNDTLIGGLGDDTLDGGGGADFMAGGDGNDYYHVDTLSDQILENPGGGVQDGIATLLTYTLPSNIEVLLLEGEEDIGGTGNSDDNILFGNSGNNILNGANGNDTLAGFAGSDNLKGGAGDDILIGYEGLDMLEGGTGMDLFGFLASSAYLDIDVIKDFNVAQGDVISIINLLGFYNSALDDLNDFVRIDAVGQNSLLKVDADGTGIGGFVTIASLQGAIGLSDVDLLVANGNLLVE